MKKNIIVYLLIILVIVGVTAGITILIMNNVANDKTEIKIEEPEEDKEIEEEKIINDEELEKYLSYIPDNSINASAYTTSTNLKNIILGYVLYKTSNTSSSISVDEVELNLQKMYNLTLDEYDLEVSEDYIASCGGLSYIYTKDNFIVENTGAPNYTKINIIEKYEFDGEDLIIYEKPATFWTYFYEPGYYLGDYSQLKDFNGAEPTFDLINLNLNYETVTLEDAQENAREYLENNKEKFTLYKHTFKKNNTGYYWYKTEVVENAKI